MKAKKKVLKKHNFVFKIVKALSFLFTRINLGFRSKDKYKIKKGERVMVLSNHQTDFDPFCIVPSFNKPLYAVATDHIFSGKYGKVLHDTLGAIPKKKGITDLRCVMEMMSVMKEGGSILLFPEGNRTYAEFQFYIGLNLVQMIKKFQCTVVLYNLHGGTGIRPRFSHKKTKGYFTGNIKRIMYPEEYNKLSDEEFLNIVKDNLKVFDSENGHEYKSKIRAEYLERMLFVCPKCGKFNTLYSKGEHLFCNECGLTVKYNSHLHLESDDPSFKFERLLDWWNYDKKWIRDYKVEEDKVIFEDNEMELITVNPFEDKKLLKEGKLSLTDKYLIFEDIKFELSKLEIASVVSGSRLIFKVGDTSYMVKGDERKSRFNPLKYVLMFNKLDTDMKINKRDNYYTLEDN